ncbi:MAG: phosphoribosylglycinamide formyltransferase [Bacteroidales bacterium]|nr:phosphoribosylglycinamide formyltransferase [Bacteroidales bacterium]
MKNIAIFASGSGTNFEALAQACADGRLDARVVLMVCDKPGAPVIERANRFGVESFVFSPKAYSSKADYEQAIVKMLDERQVDLVCLAGYMRIVSEVLLSAYRGRIINIHPSLLPAFKGAHAVEDAVAYGVKVFGITIHYVDETLDGGKIIAQKAFEYDGDDAAEVHRLGQKIEHALYVQTVSKILSR